MLIGTYLRQQAGLTSEQLLQALRQQIDLFDHGEERRLGEILIESGFVQEDQVAAALRLQAGAPDAPRSAGQPYGRVRRRRVH